VLAAVFVTVAAVVCGGIALYLFTRHRDDELSGWVCCGLAILAVVAGAAAYQKFEALDKADPPAKAATP
jgi:uncharacterized membrane protein YccC